MNPVIKNKDQKQLMKKDVYQYQINLLKLIDQVNVMWSIWIIMVKKFLHADGLLATCIQHEMDHLEGILFIDYLSKLKRSMIIKKLSKLKSNTAIL